MRRLLLVIMLLSLAACSQINGPGYAYRQNRSGDTADRRVNGKPIYTIDEQKRRARERLSLPSDEGLPPVDLSRADPVR